ncbi:MAG: TraB/GumN family protein [Gammaproteobacteria bacterium]|nr:TraB/GumN family protein [Gammaproteobacteria bacterium]
MFSIERPGTPVSYIFGSIHSGDPRVLAFSDRLRETLSSTDQFMMEIKMDQSVIFQSLTGLWLMDGRKLPDVVGERLYQMVVEAGEQAGMPEMTFTYMKPWVVMMLFSLPPGNYQQIVDVELMKMAATSGQRVIGLESIQEQFDVFDKMSISDQKILLENTLKNYPLLSKQFETLFDAYLDRDLARLQQIADKQMQQQTGARQAIERLMERLLDDRNQRMLERMLPEIENRANFIVVGALHLPGEKGLLTLLEQQGFNISVVE